MLSDRAGGEGGVPERESERDGPTTSLGETTDSNREGEAGRGNCMCALSRPPAGAPVLLCPNETHTRACATRLTDGWTHTPSTHNTTHTAHTQTHRHTRGRPRSAMLGALCPTHRGGRKQQNSLLGLTQGSKYHTVTLPSPTLPNPTRGRGNLARGVGCLRQRGSRART